jgi:hypothetical protein
VSKPSPQEYQHHEDAVRNAVFAVKTPHSGIDWLVQPFGQGTFAEDVQRALSRKRNGRPSRESGARHLPDMMVTHVATGHTCFFECKTESKKNRNSHNFSIECRSLLACAQFDRLAPTLFVFSDMRCVRVSEIIDLFKRQHQMSQRTTVTGRRYNIKHNNDVRLGPFSADGSGDPYYLVRRNALPRRTIEEYLNELISDETIYGREVIDDPFGWCL